MTINEKQESVFVMPKAEINPAFNQSKPSSGDIWGNKVLAIESTEGRKQEQGISQAKTLIIKKIINRWTERTLAVQTDTTTLHFYNYTQWNEYTVFYQCEQCSI